jgi:predicted 2-oxoglutarate/Fe(II)-dependent dioxygenase YbiX
LFYSSRNERQISSYLTRYDDNTNNNRHDNHDRCVNAKTSCEKYISSPNTYGQGSLIPR